MSPLRRHDNLVSVTRKKSNIAKKPSAPSYARWSLQDAKARFSELVRLAHSAGPQHVTLHGRDAVVIVDADEFRKLSGARTGQILVDVLQASPHREVDLASRREAMPVRAVKL